MAINNEPRLFTATIHAEGPSQILRGKIPTGLINALGGQAGEVIEFTVTGKHITGSRVLRGKNAEAAQVRARTQSKGSTANVKARVEKSLQKPLPQPKEAQPKAKSGNGKSAQKKSGNGKTGAPAPVPAAPVKSAKSGNGNGKKTASGNGGKSATAAKSPAGLNLGGLDKFKGGNKSKKSGQKKGTVQYAGK